MRPLPTSALPGPPGRAEAGALVPNSVLDAIFSSYFSQAQQQGIQVEASLAVPDKPARGCRGVVHRVCQRFGERHPRLRGASGRERKIVCKCINRPRLCLRWRIPVWEKSADQNGLPVTGRRATKWAHAPSPLSAKSTAPSAPTNKRTAGSDTADPINGCKPSCLRKFDLDTVTKPESQSLP